MKSEVLLLCIILFVVSFILFTIITAKVKEAKKHKKTNLLYALATAFSFGLVGLAGFLGLKDMLFYYFIVLQLMILVIGILHTTFLYRFVPWTLRNSFWWPFLYTFMIACLGSVFLLLVFTLLKLPGFYFILLSAVTWFFVPFLFSQMLYTYFSIPERTFKEWIYPFNQDIEDPSDRDLASPLVISFNFQKRYDDQEITIFRAKAPKNMQFGRLFYYFINDYNERNPEGMIELASKDDVAFRWVFYHKPKWFSAKKYADPDETIGDNHIKENTVIVCQRVKEF